LVILVQFLVLQSKALQDFMTSPDKATMKIPPFLRAKSIPQEWIFALSTPQSSNFDKS